MNKATKEETRWDFLWTDIMWWAVVLCLSPVGYNYLRKRGGTSHVSVTNSKTQTLCEDVFNFWNIAIIVLNMWAYKVTD